jgi:hypothetical protein
MASGAFARIDSSGAEGRLIAPTALVTMAAWT